MALVLLGLTLTLCSALAEPSLAVLHAPPRMAAHRQAAERVATALLEAEIEIGLATSLRAMLRFAEPGAAGNDSLWRPDGAACLRVVADEIWYAMPFWVNVGLPATVPAPSPPVDAGWLATLRQTLAAGLAPYDITVSGNNACPAGRLQHTVRVLPWTVNGRYTIGRADVYGVAAIGSFGNPLYPSLVFLHPEMVASGVRAGRAALHEAGHSLGLVHDADPFDPDSTWDYHDGVSPLLTAPVMGFPYAATTAHWSRGLLFTTVTGRAAQDDVVLIKQRLARERPVSASTNSTPAVVLLPTTVAGPLCVGLGAGLDTFAVAECTALDSCELHTLNVHVTPALDPNGGGLRVTLQQDFSQELYATEAAGVVCVTYRAVARATATTPLGTLHRQSFLQLVVTATTSRWDVVRRFCRWQPVHLAGSYTRCVWYGLVATLLLLGTDVWAQTQQPIPETEIKTEAKPSDSTPLLSVPRPVRRARLLRDA